MQDKKIATPEVANKIRALIERYTGTHYNNTGIECHKSIVHLVRHQCVGVVGGVIRQRMPFAKVPEFLEESEVTELLETEMWGNREGADVRMIETLHKAMYRYKKPSKKA